MQNAQREALRRFTRAALAAFLLVLPQLALAQSALQGGPGVAGRVPMYVGPASSQTFLVDSGPAGGGGTGVGLSELGITARGTGSAPYSGQGTGPFGSNICSYDAPITNATGYHWLCLSPNATTGGALISTGASGGATAIPFTFNVNGVSVTIPPGIVIGTTTVTGGSNGQCLVISAGVVGAAACGSGGSSNITIGTTSIVAGTTGRVLYDNAGVVGELPVTGTGNAVLATSPTITGLTVTGSLTATGLITNADLAATTGSGSVVLANGPTITGSFTATGLVTNADLANASITVNTQTCTLGSSCTATAAAGTLTGTTLASNVVTSSLTTVGTIGTGVWQGTAVAIGFGGTGCTAASGTCLDNITGFASTGILVRTGSGTYAFDSVAAGTGIAVTNGSGVSGNPTVALAAIAADSLLGNASAGSATPAAVALLSCSAGAQALTYNTGTHAFGCNTISGSGTVNSGAAGQMAWYPATTNVVGGNANANISNGALTLGISGTTIGQLLLAGNTSGTVTLTPQAAAGTPTITFGTASGTPAVTASAPLAIASATGNITVTGGAGKVLAGATPAFTATPTLGIVATTTGSLALVGTTSGTVTFSVADAAGTWTLKLPTTAGTAGQFMSTDGSGNATWANPAGGGTVNSGTAGQMTYYASSAAAVSGNANATISAGALTLGQAGSTIGQLILSGNTSGTTTVTPAAAASGTLTLPAATDTLIGKATTDTLTNKTYDTAGTGNSFKINGTAITAVTGTGSAVLSASPTFTGTPILSTAKATTLVAGDGSTTDRTGGSQIWTSRASTIVSVAHDFGCSDTLTFNTNGATGSACYDDETIINGTANTINHHASFQTFASYQGSGVILGLYVLNSAPSLNGTGSITTVAHINVQDATASGGGSIGNQYGLFCPSMTGATTNRCILSVAPVEFRGHLISSISSPALTSCGTSPAIVGSDNAGTVTMGTGAPTGCIITFNSAFASAPMCAVTWRATPLASQSYAISATAITLTQTGASSNKVDYVCWAQGGG